MQNVFIKKGLDERFKRDEYPIYGYLKSEKLMPKKRVARKMDKYADLYYDLQTPGVLIASSDKFLFGQKRKLFKMENKDSIIYVPEGKSFADPDIIFGIQAEFVEEPLKTDQNEAKKLLLSKYGKNK